MGFFRRLFGSAPQAESDHPRRRKVWGIRRDVVELMAQLGKESHPNEYGAALRAEGGIITELVMVPGMQGGEAHTFMNTWMLPVDPTLVGSVHSHPSPHPIPSDADRQFFSHWGHTHIIIAWPYRADTWRAYDLTAGEIELEVVP